MNDTTTPLLVTPRDAARMLAVSPRKLWTMTFEESPGLPYVRCGRLVRYSPDELRRWIEKHRKGSTTDNGVGTARGGPPPVAVAARVGTARGVIAQWVVV